MEKLLFTKDIFESLLSISIDISDDINFTLEKFEEANCFSPEFQVTNTAAYLKEFVKNMNRDTIYEIHEPLETIAVLFFINDDLVIAGPYVESEWNTINSRSLLISLGIPVSHFTSYRYYRCRYNILDTRFVMRSIEIMLEMVNLSILNYAHIKVNRDWKKMNIKEIPEPNEHSIKIIEQRYAAESEFMKAIQLGDANKANGAMNTLASFQSGLYHTKEAITNPAISATAFRTTIRLAAFQAGLSPLIIDAISQDYAQKSARLGIDRNVRKKELRPMINEICHEIQKLQRQKYSALVRKAVHYIHLNLGQNLTVNRLAEEFDVSAGYISKQFKSETGSTIINYIMDLRAEKAAELLISTNHTVQDISAYIGYIDNNYFVKVFKSRHGMTPTEYRKKYMS